jgi:hypothetical protein
MGNGDVQKKATTLLLSLSRNGIRKTFLRDLGWLLSITAKTLFGGGG